MGDPGEKSNMKKIELNAGTQEYDLAVRLMAVGVPDDIIAMATGNSEREISKIRRGLHKIRGLGILKTKRPKFEEKYGF